MGDDSPSIVEYFGVQGAGSKCGYCNNPDVQNRISHGMWTHALTVEDYQTLIDRGWRRSGSYCYKPIMNETCCPQYTIRCDATTAKPTRSQKRVMKAFARFIHDGTKPHSKAQDRISEAVMPDSKPALNSSKRYELDSNPEQSKSNEEKQEMETETSCKDLQSDPGSEKDGKPLPSKNGKKNDRGDHSCEEGKSKKKRQMRIERYFQRLKDKGIDPSTVEYKRNRKNQEKSVEEFLNLQDSDKNAHKFQLRLIRTHPPSQQFHDTFEESHNVYWNYQTTIHSDPPSKPSDKQFRRFLCTSPLRATNEILDHPGYGSFHQQYLLDGKIIAVGVIDILPHSVSSKYLYYDPQYGFLSLGTYSAMQEIALVRRLARVTPELKYYYMGFYVHNCPKMKYKGRFGRSELLCPEAYTWEDIGPAVVKLDKNKYSRLSQSGLEDKDVKNIEMERVLVLYERAAMPYAIYSRVKKFQKEKDKEEDRKEVKEYAELVGKKCAYRMLIYRRK